MGRFGPQNGQLLGRTVRMFTTLNSQLENAAQSPFAKQLSSGQRTSQAAQERPRWPPPAAAGTAAESAWATTAPRDKPRNGKKCSDGRYVRSTGCL